MGLASPQALAASLAAVALAIGAVAGWRATGSPWARFLVATIPLLLLAALGVLGATVRLVPLWPWSAARLAPAVGLWRGIPLFSPEHGAPVNGWLYGPVAALLWAPSGLAPSPSAALSIAAAVNAAAVLAPLFWAIRRAGDGPVAALCWVMAASGLLHVFGSWYVLSVLNVDAVAIGLGLCACACLPAQGEPNVPTLAVAAALCALAAWTKQTDAALLPVLALYAGTRFGARSGWRLLAYGSFFAALLGIIFAGRFGARQMLFNMWTVPASHEVVGGGAAVLSQMLHAVASTWLWWAMALGAAALLGRQAANGAYLAAAIGLLPLGAMASRKVGGGENSLHSIVYVAAAAGVGLCALGRTRRIAGAAALLGACIALALARRTVAGYATDPYIPKLDVNGAAAAMARLHPGRVYFPWNPLANVYGENAAYHFEYGILDRELAGKGPSGADIQAGLPRDMEVVAYPLSGLRHRMLEGRDDFVRLDSDGPWMIYVRRGPPARR